MLSKVSYLVLFLGGFLIVKQYWQSLVWMARIDKRESYYYLERKERTLGAPSPCPQLKVQWKSTLIVHLDILKRKPVYFQERICLQNSYLSLYMPSLYPNGIKLSNPP
jgi:hypothetical protein